MSRTIEYIFSYIQSYFTATPDDGTNQIGGTNQEKIDSSYVNKQNVCKIFRSEYDKIFAQLNKIYYDEKIAKIKPTQDDSANDIRIVINEILEELDNPDVQQWYNHELNKVDEDGEITEVEVQKSAQVCFKSVLSRYKNRLGPPGVKDEEDNILFDIEEFENERKSKSKIGVVDPADNLELVVSELESLIDKLTESLSSQDDIRNQILDYLMEPL